MRRSASIEVLRCLLMFLIVLGHCANFTGLGGPPVYRSIHAVTIFAVNAFCLISGWYGIKFSARKIVHLLSIGLYSFLILLLLRPMVPVGGDRVAFSMGWFGAAYLGLILVSPIVNAGFERLWSNNNNDLHVAYFLCVVLMVVDWLPLNSIGIDFKIPGFGAHTFNQMLFMYLTGRILSKSEWIAKQRKGLFAYGFATFMFLNIVTAIATGLTRENETIQALLVGSRGYNSPVVIMMSICIFVWFQKWRAPKILGDICLMLAPSMFSVYLIHEATNHLESLLLYNRFFVFRLISVGNIGAVVSIVVCAICTYLACIVLDIPRRVVASYFKTIKAKSK